MWRRIPESTAQLKGRTYNYCVSPFSNGCKAKCSWDRGQICSETTGLKLFVHPLKYS